MAPEAKKLQEQAAIPLFGVTGPSGSGKTVVLEGLLREFARRGRRVAALKHCPRGFDPGDEGKDSRRLAQAGAETVILHGPGAWVATGRLSGAAPDPAAFAAALAAFCRALALDPPELLLVEGYHGCAIPTVHVWGPAPEPRPPGPCCQAQVWGPRAMASPPTALPSAPLPTYQWNDPAGLADLIERVLGM